MDHIVGDGEGEQPPQNVGGTQSFEMNDASSGHVTPVEPSPGQQESPAARTPTPDPGSRGGALTRIRDALVSAASESAIR